MLSPVFVSYHLPMGDAPKFDYGDSVQVKAGKHKDRSGDVVAINITTSSRTYTVEFGDGSDAEIQEELLSKVNA